MNESQKDERIADFVQQQVISNEQISARREDDKNKPINETLARPTSNTPRECLFLTCAKDFQLRYPRRKLFLTAKNEYDVDKLVCTTLRPTLIPYPELGGCDTAESCAAFMALFLQYEYLKNDAQQLPSHLSSSMQILKWNGVADCFDYSTFLVSLLLGSGYDAYVVQGYAPRCICEGDRSAVACPRHVYPPYLNEEGYHEVLNPITVENVTKEEEQHDEGTTQLIHCWVLVILKNTHCGRMETYDSPVFIESTTGDIYPLSASQLIPYTGVETVWNGKNHWMNVQEGASVQSMSFDMANQEMWLPVFYSINKGTAPCEVPSSWADKIKIPEASVQLRYLPDGERVLFHLNTKIELFADGVHSDGLISRISFHNVHRTDLIYCKEVYTKRRRKDHLSMRSRDPQKMQELYFPSHKSGICQYTEIPGKLSSIQFNVDARLDGLVKQEEVFGECIIQEYVNNEEGKVKRVITIKSLDDGVQQDEYVLLLSRGVNNTKVEVLTVVDTFDLVPGELQYGVLYKRTYDFRRGLIEDQTLQNEGSIKVIRRELQKLDTLCNADSHVTKALSKEGMKMVNEVQNDDQFFSEFISTKKRFEYNGVYFRKKKASDDSQHAKDTVVAASI